MSDPIPFARPATLPTPSTDSMNGGKPSFFLKPTESERLHANVARTLVLAGRNPFAAALVINMTETILKFFDA